MDKNANNWKELTLGNPQEEPPKRIKKPKRRRKLLWAIISVVAILAAVAAVFFWDQSAVDGLRRSLIYMTAEKDDSGCARLYEYAGDKTSSFAAPEGTMVNLSCNQLIMVNEKGVELVNEGIRFTAPALCANAERAVAYDVGGSDLYVLGRKGILWSLQDETEILSAAVNEKNYVTVTGNKSGYKGAVSVYDPEGEMVFEYHSADRFLMCAALSRDSRTLLIIAMGQESGHFASYGVLYRINSTKELDTVAIKGLVYDVGWVDGAFCIATEDGVYFLTENGELTGSYSIDSAYLRRCTMDGSGYAAVLLSRYRNGTQNQLITLDAEGNELGCCDVEGEVMSISSAGQYTAVLCSDRLTVYDRELQVVAELEDSSEARQVLMRSDGSAVLAGTSSASLYLP